MFLALDIGNSATKFGFHDGSAWRDLQRLADPAGELRPYLSSLIDVMEVEAAGIASVVPERTMEVCGVINDCLGIDAVVVGAHSPLPLEMGYVTPETLGADRIAAACAAWVQFGRATGRATLVIDAGTAVTTEVISSEGVYLGGAIAPGPDALRRSLARDAVQLREFEWPKAIDAVGRSTHEAMAGGVSVMFLDGVAGLVRRSAHELSEQPIVVATGGWAEWLNDYLPEIDAVEPNLVLEGIRLLAG